MSQNLFFFLQLQKCNDDLEKEELLVCEKEIIAEDEPEEIDDSLNCCTYVDLIYYGLYFVLWATIYAIFIKLQFGTVYFVLSAIIGMYLNTRTTPKKENEISAYSVFNQNCKSIDGTLKGEQFEREMGYRM